MTENKMKGLFGGGEASDAPVAQHVEGRARGGRRGGGGGRRRRRSPEEVAQARDFIQRYTTGHPAEGFSSDEAVNYLRELRNEAPPEVMQRAAVETVRNLPEDQRKAFAEMLQRRQAGSNMVTIERTGETHTAEGRSAQPGGGGMDDMLGGLFGSLFGGGSSQQQPQPRQVPQDQGGFGTDDMLGGLLGGLLGGGQPQPQPQPRGSNQPDNNPFNDLLGGLFGGGGAATSQGQQPQAQGGGVDEILSSPLGKAVLGGIAAFAMKEMMDGNR